MNQTTKTNKIYTVTDLTKEVKFLLESNFSFVWILGEISNYTVSISGHAYFSLKDSTSIINCVMFKSQKISLKFEPSNGMKIICMARLSLYEARGVYQLILEYMEPEGIGALHLSFEQLKKKLGDEGLFDESRKKKIPILPGKISIITSVTGAAIRDIIKVSGSRFPNCHLEILPVRVQGDNAEKSIVEAIKLLNTLKRSEIIIIARGGGSFEDLTPFNTEIVARAIYLSEIPVITGIGHETDFTIADFVADLRAPSPSAAAMCALPDKYELIKYLQSSQNCLSISIKKRIDFLRSRLSDLKMHIRNPIRMIDDFRLRLTDLEFRMIMSFRRDISFWKEKFLLINKQMIHSFSAEENKNKMQYMIDRLDSIMANIIERMNQTVNNFNRQLLLMAPESVLSRGYSVTRILGNKKPIKDAHTVDINQSIEIILAKGKLNAYVEKKHDGEKENL